MSKLHVKLSLCSTALGHQMSVPGGNLICTYHLKNLNTLAVLCFASQRSFLQKTNEQIKQNIKDLLLYCSKLRPYLAFYKMQIKTCNNTAHHILMNEVDLILPKFHEGQKSKRGIFSTIISGFIGLVLEGISSLLHNRRHKAVKAMSVTTDMQRNKLAHLENTLVMYGIYNAETLENLVKTVHALHS